MEQILNKLSNLPESKTVSNLPETIIAAKGLLQTPSTACFRKRAKCIQVFELTLGSGKTKLAHAAIDGLQMLLRDPALNSDADTMKEADTLSAQLIQHLTNLPELDKQIQCQVVVSLISSTDLKISLNDVYAAMQICTKTYTSSEEPSVKFAVRATLTQIFNSYCINRYSKTLSGSQEEIAVFMDMTALLTELLTRIDSGNGTPEEIQLALDSIYSVLSVQPTNFHRHQPFLNFFNSELIPSMLCLIQTSTEKPVATKSKILSLHRKESKKPQRANIFIVPDSPRSFYQVSEQILRLMAQVPDSQDICVEYLRTVFLTPPASKRTEALKLLKRLLTNPSRLVELLELMALDASVWPIIIECIEECAKCENEVAVESVRALNSLLDSINVIMDKPEILEDLSDCFYTKICEKNANIEAEEENRVTEVIHKVSSSKSSKNKSTAEEYAKSVDNFLERLRSELPKWIELVAKPEVDKKIQEFASHFALNFSTSDENAESQFLSPDAIYLTTYSVLSFCLRFRESSINKEWLLEQVKGAGGLAYLDEKWLATVQERVLSDNVLEDVAIPSSCALIDLVEDYDGYNKKLLTDEKKTASGEEHDVSHDMRAAAFQTWSKRLIRSCWRTITEILNRFPLKVSKKQASEKTTVDGTEACIEAMRTLCTTLLNFKLDKEILWLYEKMGENVCDLEELREFVVKNADSKKIWPMTRLDALGMDLLLDNAIACGTLSNQCWKYVVRGIQYATELERYLFRITKNSNTGYDVKDEGLRELLESFGQNELPVGVIGKILDELMLKIDSLLENAIKSLNLGSTCSLLSYMVSSNEDILKYSDVQIDRALESCNILQRISRLVVGASTRPLVHKMKMWSTIRDHFIELTREKFPEEVSKRAVSSLHECIKALADQETHGFCFNQTLFDAFQNVLCLEVCKPETQEHVVAILSMFLQESPDLIGSGWKPLLGAVKAVRISSTNRPVEEDDDHPSRMSRPNMAVLDFLKAYIELNKPEVLMPTLPEFIQCLINYLQTQGATVEDSDGEEARLCETAFTYVVQIQALLLKHFEEDSIPVQEHLVKRLKQREKSHLGVEDASYMKKMESPLVPPLTQSLVESEQFRVFPSQLDESPKKQFPGFPWQDLSESRMAICELLLNLIEQLAALVVTCIPQLHQRLLFDLSDFFATIKTTSLGMPFGAFSLSTIILPMMQKWVQREKYGYLASIEMKNTSIRNLKQTTGVFTELVADYIKGYSDSPWSERLLQDMLLLFNEYISHPSQFISGIACACLKHLLLSTNVSFTKEMWNLAAKSLWRAIQITLFPLRTLTAQFFPDSTDFGGDLREVHVSIKKDEVERDYTELQFMAKQVFTLETDNDEKEPKPEKADSAVASHQLAYVFMFRAKKDERSKKTNESNEKIPESLNAEDIIVSLMNHAMVLQVISTILLGETSRVLNSGSFVARQDSRKADMGDTNGLIHKIPHEVIGTLFWSLDAASLAAEEFDARPAIKVLLQKLFNIEHHANLYKNMIATKSIKLMVVYELIRSMHSRPADTANGSGKVEDEYMRIIEQTMKKLFTSLKTVDRIVTNAKIEKFLRERVEQKLDISLIECDPLDPKEHSKTFKVVSASKCLEEFRREKRSEALPAKTVRANPFISSIKVEEEPLNSSSESNQKMPLSKLNDLDLKILSYSEIALLLFERLASEESKEFVDLLPYFYHLLCEYLRLAPNERARNVIVDIFERIPDCCALFK